MLKKEKSYDNILFKWDTIKLFIDKLESFYVWASSNKFRWDFNFWQWIIHDTNWNDNLISFINEYNKFSFVEAYIFSMYNDESFISLTININWFTIITICSKEETIINSLFDYIDTFYEKERDITKFEGTSGNINENNYFSIKIIDELRNIENIDFDLTKLIEILEEVNMLYKNKMYLWITPLLRMLIDHIPPIFWKKNFESLISEWSFWINSNKNESSDKKIIKRLIDLCKNISDSNLHTQISNKELLPNEINVNFKIEFDTLLKYIIKELNK